MRKIKKEIRVDNKGGKVFEALITPSLIKKWWGASQAIVVPDEGGIYALTWGENIDKPEYIATAKIQEFKPNVRLILDNYTYLKHNDYLPFKANFKVKFVIECFNNYCVLSVEHTGFPQEKTADNFYNDCEKGWDETLEAVKKISEEQ